MNLGFSWPGSSFERVEQKATVESDENRQSTALPRP